MANRITKAETSAETDPLARTQAQRREAMLATGERAAAILREPATANDHADWLYDDQGLPKFESE